MNTTHKVNFDSLTPDEKYAYRAGERCASSSKPDYLRVNPYSRLSQTALWRLWWSGYKEHREFLSGIDR